MTAHDPNLHRNGETEDDFDVVEPEPSIFDPEITAERIPAMAKETLSLSTSEPEVLAQFEALLELGVDKSIRNLWAREVANLTAFGKRDVNALHSKAIVSFEAKAEKKGKKPKVSRTSDPILKQFAYGANVIVKARGKDGDPVVYRSGNALVTLSQPDPDDPRRAIVEASVSSLIQVLTNHGEWREGKGDTPVQAPMSVAVNLLNDPELDAPVARLKAIVEAPFYTADGRLIRTEGWDEQSGVYYAPGIGFDVDEVPENPSDEEVAEARAKLVDVFGDFPFRGGMTRARLEAGEDCADLAHLIAWMMTPVIRELLGSSPLAPLLLISKPTQGSGAGKALAAAQLIMAGTTDLRPALPKRPEEQHKEIVSVLRSNMPFMCFDDVEEVGGKPLSLLLTATNYSGRTLTQSETRVYPNRLSIAVTGNNPVFSKDLRRRVIGVRIEPQVERPELRDASEWKYARLEDHVMANRGELYRSLLVLVQRWLAAGRPAPAEGAPTIATYEAWSQAVGAILELSKIGGFLTNRNLVESEVSDPTDVEDSAKTFVAKWIEAAGKTGRNTTPISLTKMLSKDLVTMCEEHKIDTGLEPRHGGISDYDYHPKGFGKWLGRQHERIFNIEGDRWQVWREPTRDPKGTQWTLRKL